MVSKDFSDVLSHDRTSKELKEDFQHFDPENSVLLLVYFSREGIGRKYYYRTYILNNQNIWAGIGNNEPLPVLIAWDEPPDGEYPNTDTTPVDRPTIKMIVGIKSLNVRNGPSLNSSKQYTTLALNDVLEIYTDKQIPEPMEKTIVWVEIKTINGKLPKPGYVWTALKYLNPYVTTNRPIKEGVVDTELLRIRDKANTSGNRVGAVSRGQKVTYFTDNIVLEEPDLHWAEVYMVDGKPEASSVFIRIDFLK